MKNSLRSRVAKTQGRSEDSSRVQNWTAENEGSEQVRRQLRQIAPLTLREDDVPGELLAAELVGRDREAVARAVDVRVVDLPRIAGEDDLRPVARARDDRLHFVRRQVLRLV